MSIVEALILVLFGIALPTWDVGSDINFSRSFLMQKCYSWADYVRDYKNGLEPHVNQSIGKLKVFQWL